MPQLNPQWGCLSCISPVLLESRFPLQKHLVNISLPQNPGAANHIPPAWIKQISEDEGASEELLGHTCSL